MKFIRKNGRVIPIRDKKEGSIARGFSRIGSEVAGIGAKLTIGSYIGSKMTKTFTPSALKSFKTLQKVGARSFIAGLAVNVIGTSLTKTKDIRSGDSGIYFGKNANRRAKLK
jgi:hypothetical protein